MGGVSLLSVGCDAGDQNCRMYPFGPISIIRIAERTLLGRSASSEFEIGIFGQVLSVEPTAGLKKTCMHIQQIVNLAAAANIELTAASVQLSNSS